MKELIRHILREHTREIGEIRKSTTPEFIEKAKSVHGDKYDYSQVNYKNSSTPIKIICPIHGEFTQTPDRHVNQKSGCNKCAGREMTSQDDFFRLAKKTHGDKYDYSQVKYDKSKTPVKIICPIHGEFTQQPANHVSGQGCPECGITKRNKSLESNGNEFIEKAKKIHGDKYDYSKVNYNKSDEKVEIICPIHGSFFQTPNKHLLGRRCPKCATESMVGLKTKSYEDFVKEAKKVHGNKYKYDEFEYKNRHTPTKILCPIHGSFLQSPANHIKGQGCPVCRESKGEKLINDLLLDKKVEFIRQHKFVDCTNKLKYGACRKLPFDFYLPKLNTVIEYDGQQHYVPVWGEDNFKNLQRLDKIRNQYCKKNGIKLIRIPYTMKKEEIEPYILKELGIQ
jgi:very-short-patch-repair endonuclease